MTDVLANKDVLQVIENFAYFPDGEYDENIRNAVIDFYDAFQDFCKENYTRGEVKKVLNPVAEEDDFDFFELNVAIKGVKPFDVSVISSQLGFLLGLIHANSIIRRQQDERD